MEETFLFSLFGSHSPRSAPNLSVSLFILSENYCPVLIIQFGKNALLLTDFDVTFLRYSFNEKAWS